MPADYHIIDVLRLKYVTVWGSTHIADMRDLATRYLADPSFSFEHVQLIDLAKLTNTDAGFSDVFGLRNFYLRAYKQAVNPVRIAIFAPTDLGYGVSRMFTSLMIGQRVMDIRIFELLPDALEWLGIDQEGPEWGEAEDFLSEKPLKGAAIQE